MELQPVSMALVTPSSSLQSYQKGFSLRRCQPSTPPRPGMLHGAGHAGVVHDLTTNRGSSMERLKAGIILDRGGGASRPKSATGSKDAEVGRVLNVAALWRARPPSGGSARGVGGGRYFIYRPPLESLIPVRWDTCGQDLTGSQASWRGRRLRSREPDGEARLRVALLEDAAANGNGSSPARGTYVRVDTIASTPPGLEQQRSKRTRPHLRPGTPPSTSATAVDSRRNLQGLSSTDDH